VRIVTWNVNSLKQRLPRLLPWLDQRRPDVVCLQETKLADDKLIEARLTELLGAPDSLVLPTITHIHASVLPVLAAGGCAIGDDGPPTSQTRDVAAFTRLHNPGSVDIEPSAIRGIITLMMMGVTIAPIDAPLCNTLFPRPRSSSTSERRIVCIAHGQCPDSKNPRSIRQ
jgi:hypothetical protein